ncbi:MFS transporter [Marinobacter sp.]|uniref:MFS transporter n=1 Tax=Marinobacter sp. TaxID=50741 RepID=UPI003B51ED31
MVVVNTVVIVQGDFGLTDQHTTMAFAAFGAGSMLAALVLPVLLKRWKDRPVMLAWSWVLLGGLGAAWFADSLYMLMPVWALLGVGFSRVQTPIGRLLTQSSHGEDRPALFAAQFSLSHAGWLVAYPLAGWLGSSAGIQPTLIVLAVLGLVFLIAATRLWPADDSLVVAHSHHDLPRDHPHRRESEAEHSHRYVIDELHPRWSG